jgi:hypothetical protein
MKKTTIILLTVLISSLAFSQNDTLNKKSITLEEVKVTTNTSLKLKQKNGKHEVSVVGTSFQNTQNTWEGLKQVPMLRANEGGGLKVNNKNAIVEINGVQSQMSGTDLENYLKSLDPKTIKKIEINSNPNSSYGTEVDAVVNIILSQKQDSYRLGMSTTNGFHSKYFNNSNINYAINSKKSRLFATYNFEYLPKINTSEVIQQIGNQQPLNIDYKENEKLRNHQAYINLNFDLGNKNQIDLSSIVNFSNNDKFGNSYNATYNRNIGIISQNKTIQFAEVWRHYVNDSVSLKIGAYQVYKNSNSTNNALTNGISPENQLVKTTIPIYIGFLDYSNKNKLGLSALGLRYNDINVKNENNSIINNVNSNSPFQYQEKVFASYLNHSFDISKSKSIALGIRSESSFINYNFQNSLTNQTYSNKNNYTNLLYNVSYNWQTKKEWDYSLAFRKQIQRPNYSSLNPFKSISSDLIYFSGESQIVPAKLYSFNFETTKNEWSFYMQTGLIKDFISTFTKVENNTITETYRNFKNLYFSGFGLEYNKELFNKKWITKISIDVIYYKQNDSNYTFDNSTPSTSFTTINTIDLGKKYKLNINYNLNNSYKDGLIKHYQKQSLDLVLSKKFNTNFSILLFANDIFKTSYFWEDTTIPDYLYGSKIYNDIRSVGLTLKWNITGKSYKGRELEKPEGDPIERL